MSAIRGSDCLITRRGTFPFPPTAGAARIMPLPDRSSSAGGHAKPGCAQIPLSGSCVYAVMASWAIICLAQLAQVDGQVVGGVEGVGVVLAQDPAAADESVAVQGA